MSLGEKRLYDALSIGESDFAGTEMLVIESRVDKKISSWDIELLQPERDAQSQKMPFLRLSVFATRKRREIMCFQVKIYSQSF